MTREQLDAALSIHVSYLRDLLTQLTRGTYDDCDPGLLTHLGSQVDDLRVALDVARRAFR